MRHFLMILLNWMLNVKGWPRRSTTSHLYVLCVLCSYMCVMILWGLYMNNYSLNRMFFMFHEGLRVKSKNHDVRKVCLEMTLCVLGSFIEIYVFFWAKIDVRHLKIVYMHFGVGNIRAKVHEDMLRALEVLPIMWAKTAKKQSYLRRVIDALVGW